MLKDTSSVRAHGVAVRARALSEEHGGKAGRIWDDVRPGFSVTMSEGEAKKLTADPDVKYVEQNQRLKLTDTQASPPSWGLDRVDQRVMPLDTTYNYEASAGANVHVYIVDSGINKDHADFGGRASYGYDFVDNDAIAEDTCLGHGTHVAGTIGGTTYGVAKKALLVAVRSFDCSRNATEDNLIAGLKWVNAHAIKPAVMNLSIGATCVDGAGSVAPCPTGAFQSVVNEETAAITAGIPVVAGAGNDAVDACENPVAAAPNVIGVGATAFSGDSDVKAPFSDFGPCVDIWAPGKDIVSDFIGSTTATKTMSGTSQATPHVTGTVALLLGTSQFANATPAQISDQLLNKMATPGIIQSLGSTSPNKFLFTGLRPVAGGSPVALARNADGRLTLIGTTKGGRVLGRTQSAVDADTWNSPVISSTTGWDSVSAETNSNNRIEFTALQSSHQIWRRRQVNASAIDSWAKWSQSTGFLSSVAIARRNGRLEMFGINEKGELWQSTQTAPGSTSWGEFTRDSTVVPFGILMRSVTAETDGAGNITVIMLDISGQQWVAIEAVDDSMFPATKLDGGKILSEVALARNQSGKLELIGTDDLGQIIRRSQVSLSSKDYSPWTSINSKMLRHVAAETNANGTIKVVGVDDAGDVWQSTQTSTDSVTYSLWSSINSQLRS